ncbi:MAG: M48 family metallopeptidase [Clostridium sp.]|uniref:M48 family metallopeptidase n=1 Tax=Clostridium sp. TaxID=1506 RepID=UPI0025B8A13D|nr:SprT family zinc-dependent metalloprotease [Clostridium sp.]MCE5220308.1 M48 family metallopeptidase [Clostridium sp.]
MRLKFEYKNKEIEFDIIHRKRKTISIKVEENGQVIVSAPLRINKEYILKIVQNKADWILKKQDKVNEKSSKKITREITEGSTFMYLGEEYPLNLIFDESKKNIIVELSKEAYDKPIKYITSNIKIKSENKSEREFFERQRFIIYTNTMDIEKIKVAFEKWYRAETLKIVTKRIDYYADNFKDKVTNIRVKEQKRRWASCTGKNAILFNWRISMARADVLDYIVVHEMCHMDHRNHSKYFWNRVEEIMPNYREKHGWLKINGMNLYL